MNDRLFSVGELDNLEAIIINTKIMAEFNFSW